MIQYSAPVSRCRPSLISLPPFVGFGVLDVIPDHVDVCLPSPGRLRIFCSPPALITGRNRPGISLSTTPIAEASVGVLLPNVGSRSAYTRFTFFYLLRQQFPRTCVRALVRLPPSYPFV